MGEMTGLPCLSTTRSIKISGRRTLWTRTSQFRPRPRDYHSHNEFNAWSEVDCAILVEGPPAISGPK